MRFTISQVRSALNIPPQTMRYWRNVLGPLREKWAGKATRFSIGDIVALSVIGKLVNNLHVDVSALAPIAPKVFELCKRPSFVSPNTVLVLDLLAGEAAVTDARERISATTPIVLIPLFEVIQDTRKRLLDHDDPEQEQAELPLPLTSVK